MYFSIFTSIYIGGITRVFYVSRDEKNVSNKPRVVPDRGFLASLPVKLGVTTRVVCMAWSTLTSRYLGDRGLRTLHFHRARLSASDLVKRGCSKPKQPVSMIRGGFPTRVPVWLLEKLAEKK